MASGAATAATSCLARSFSHRAYSSSHFACRSRRRSSARFSESAIRKSYASCTAKNWESSPTLSGCVSSAAFLYALRMSATDEEGPIPNKTKASAARARKSLQIIKGLSHTLRKNIVEYSKGLPTKKRAGDEVAAEPIVAEVPITPKAPKAPRKRKQDIE